MRMILSVLLLLSVIAGNAQDSTKKADTDAHFPGDVAGWHKFLAKNLHYPDEAVNNEIHGDVVVEFQIDEQGNVSDIKAISGPKKGGLREEAVRIITVSGKWEPAIKNNIAVKSMRKETISFKMSVQ